MESEQNWMDCNGCIPSEERPGCCPMFNQVPDDCVCDYLPPNDCISLPDPGFCCNDCCGCPPPRQDIMPTVYNMSYGPRPFRRNCQPCCPPPCSPGCYVSAPPNFQVYSSRVKNRMTFPASSPAPPYNGLSSYKHATPTLPLQFQYGSSGVPNMMTFPVSPYPLHESHAFNSSGQMPLNLFHQSTVQSEFPTNSETLANTLRTIQLGNPSNVMTNICVPEYKTTYINKAEGDISNEYNSQRCDISKFCLQPCDSSDHDRKDLHKETFTKHLPNDVNNFNSSFGVNPSNCPFNYPGNFTNTAPPKPIIDYTTTSFASSCKNNIPPSNSSVFPNYHVRPTNLVKIDDYDKLDITDSNSYKPEVSNENVVTVEPTSLLIPDQLENLCKIEDCHDVENNNCQKVFEVNCENVIKFNSNEDNNNTSETVLKNISDEDNNTDCEKILKYNSVKFIDDDPLDCRPCSVEISESAATAIEVIPKKVKRARPKSVGPFAGLLLKRTSRKKKI